MPPRKRAAPLAPDPPTPPLDVSVARLQERVDGFQEKTFPLFCQGLDRRLESLEAKLDRAVIRNGEFEDVKVMAQEWKDSRLRREGAITVLRFSWKLVGAVAGAAAGTGISGGGFFWLLGKI